MSAADGGLHLVEGFVDPGQPEPPEEQSVDVTHGLFAQRWLSRELGQNALSGLFRRGEVVGHCPQVGEAGYIEPPGDDDDGPAQIRAASAAMLAGLVGEKYEVFRTRKNKNGSESTSWPVFPKNIAEAVLEVAGAETTPFLRPLRGVTHVPLPRADGSLLDQPGYDETSGYLLLPDIEVPAVRTVPSEGQVVAAVALVRGLLSGFPWASPDGHDEANLIGLMVTPLLRLRVPGPYKLGAICAHQPGSGKTLLAQVLQALHGAVMRAELPRDDAEMEKAIFSILACTTAPYVVFDNVSGLLKSSRLDGLLTAKQVSGRELGKSTERADLQNDRVWVVTGNNMKLGGDTARRTLWVNIDPGRPNPERRTGFAIPDLGSHVAAHRGEILAALLTIVNNWQAQGAPVDVAGSDGYATWSGSVRAMLRLAGMPGEFDHHDPERDEQNDDGWARFLLALEYAMGSGTTWTIGELPLTAFPAVGQADAHHALVDALPGDLNERYVRARQDPAAIKQSLGKWFENREGRWAANRCIRSKGMSSRKVRQWSLERYADTQREDES